jgi:hypothetical protein
LTDRAATGLVASHGAEISDTAAVFDPRCQLDENHANRLATIAGTDGSFSELKSEIERIEGVFFEELVNNLNQAGNNLDHLVGAVVAKGLELSKNSPCRRVCFCAISRRRLRGRISIGLVEFTTFSLDFDRVRCGLFKSFLV